MNLKIAKLQAENDFQSKELTTKKDEIKDNLKELAVKD